MKARKKSSMPNLWMTCLSIYGGCWNPGLVLGHLQSSAVGQNSIAPLSHRRKIILIIRNLNMLKPK